MRRSLTIAGSAELFAGIPITAAVTHPFPGVPDNNVHAEGIEWAHAPTTETGTPPS